MPIEVNVRGARILVPSIEDHLYMGLSKGGWYESDLLGAIQKLMKPRSVYVDVGAHIGNHTLFFAIKCDASRVIAIEPHPDNFALLQRNVVLNGLEDVVWSVNALVHPTWTTATARYSDSEPLFLRTMLPQFEEGGPVPCYPLDWALSDDTDVVKIDVEEAGPSVLISGLNGIRRCRPLIAIEAATPELERQIAEILIPEGYQCEGQFCSTPTFIWSPA